MCVEKKNIEARGEKTKKKINENQQHLNGEKKADRKAFIVKCEFMLHTCMRCIHLPRIYVQFRVS